ncbi:FmdB family zinc ribbon protein [Acidithrix ferrooxidans]|uniref:Zinc ribbon domain protein n=1 Tax=Acidithrix ferrooxidans TaxID=1280514 RepID=A0A0D8HG86_9ACTN|nr:FmdB family zinc ribbon protein [Acidithrix ferrooxidans]KJF16985.1 zinc ribbon domain protein [Acidithrix ferrooxidans]
MPKYEYLCKSCGNNFEVTQSFTDDSLTVCEICGGELRKVFGSIGIAFKGSGFYRNDSKSTSSSIRPPASTGEATTVAPTTSESAAPAATTEKKSTPESSPAPASPSNAS